MQSFVETVKSAASFLIGTSTSETADAAAAAAADSNELNVELERRPDDSGTRQGKRRREGGSPKIEGSKVKWVLGPHDHRLTELFCPSPLDAVLIAVPHYDDDWNPDPREDMGGGYRGGIKPTNTLEKSAPQAASRPFGHYVNHRPASLSTQTVRGDNVRMAEDTFEQHEAVDRRPKRQRTNPPGKPTVQKSSQTVDLTEDADHDVFNGVAHSRTRQDSTATQPERPRGASQLDDSFAMGESARADVYTTMSKPTRSARNRGNHERRSGSQQSSVQGSARSPLHADQDKYPDNITGSRNSPMVIDGGSQEVRASSTQGSRQRPMINLAKDLPEIQIQPRESRMKAARASQQDLETANSMLCSSRPTDEPPRHARLAQAGGNWDEPGNLRHKFTRDGNARQPKAKDKMRTESRVYVRDEGSPDQLGGARTVMGHSSPHKDTGKRPQSSAKTNDLQQARLPPGIVGQQSEKRAASPPSDGDTEDIFESGSVPIRSLFSKQCIEEQEGLSLVWDHEDNQFLVACGEQKVRLPHRTALVTVGKDEVAVSWQHSGQSAKAMLKGSSTEFSNGTMIIEFKNAHGLNACYNYLMHATNNCMKSIPADAEYMEKLFTTQRKTLREAHDRLWKNSSAGPAVMPGDRRAGWQVVQDQSDNEIQYESESGTLSEVLGQQRCARPTGEQSHHFLDDSARKSSRQVKSTVTKPRSPSPPPRWSDENQVPIWQHPVVYPSRGAQRVTVYDSDVVRLDEGEYLNDNLLGFAIRRIEETMDPQHKGKVHFFNTFFYSTLMKSNKRFPDYEAVKRWTKNTDIFSIPYTVVPINNDLHWYFAIICNLGFLNRKLCGTEHEREDVVLTSFEDVTSGIINVDRELSAELRPRSPTQSEAMVDDKSNNVIYFDDNGTVSQTGGHAAFSRPDTAAGKKLKKPKQKATPSTRKYDIDAPVVIMLDSFGHARSVESKALKLYIQAEAKEKRQMHVDIGEIQGLNAKGLPAQPNFCDCGVFVIGYLIEFAKDPDMFVKKILRREMDPERDFKNFSAPELRNTIRDTLFEVADEQAEERRIHKAQKRAKAAQQSTPAKASKQSSPMRQQPPAQEISNATLQSTSTPAPPAARSMRSSPMPTSQTAPQSSFDQAAPGRATGVLDSEDELEVSAPMALALASNRSPASSLYTDIDEEEMLDVPASDQRHGPGIPPSPYVHNLFASTGSSLTAFASKKASSAGSVNELPSEIGDSQGLGYD